MTGRIIDVNVNLSRWPTRRYPLDETSALVARLRKVGVVEAWAGSLDGLLYKDLAGVNARLAAECRAQQGVQLVPFGSVNPMLPDWEEDLRRCAEDHGMPGIRLHPNYHGYQLDHPEFARLLALAAGRGLIVSLPLVMEDARTMHPLIKVPQVDPAPLVGLLAKTPGLKLVLLNTLAFLLAAKSKELLQAGQVYVELAYLESVGGLAKLLEFAPPDRVLFGSHAPCFNVESALLKLEESPLTPEHLRAVQEQNARTLMRSGVAP